MKRSGDVVIGMLALLGYCPAIDRYTPYNTESTAVTLPTSRMLDHTGRVSNIAVNISFVPTFLTRSQRRYRLTNRVLCVFVQAVAYVGSRKPRRMPMLTTSLSRRQMLRGALVSSSLGLAMGYPPLAFAQSAAPTPQCHDGDEATIRQTDGPYFKPSSPQRADLVEHDAKGRLVELNGQVLTRSCRPVERALVDLWHADEYGEYDNAGFRYRGHLFTDGEGRYRFRTILPALYPGRTRHYHIKVQASERPVLTTQLYFPDEPANRRDGLFRRELVMRIAEAPGGFAAHFDFVVDIR